jgi:uncharacterized protein YfcZ (UPF0381/DUF406 family)
MTYKDAAKEIHQLYKDGKTEEAAKYLKAVVDEAKQSERKPCRR